MQDPCQGLTTCEVHTALTMAVPGYRGTGVGRSLYLWLSRLGVFNLDIGWGGSLPLPRLGKLRLDEESDLALLLSCCRLLQVSLLLLGRSQSRRCRLCWRLLLPWGHSSILMLCPCTGVHVSVCDLHAHCRNSCCT